MIVNTKLLQLGKGLSPASSQFLWLVRNIL